jgi:hypothetical protein
VNRRRALISSPWKMPEYRSIASISPLASPCSAVAPLPKLPPLSPALSSSTVSGRAEKLCVAK